MTGPRFGDAMDEKRSLSYWLLFLGAGASVPRPTDLPTFADLSASVLQGFGWEAVAGPKGQDGGR
jgi:hypothetical protein